MPRNYGGFFLIILLVGFFFINYKYINFLKSTTLDGNIDLTKRNDFVVVSSVMHLFRM